MNTRATDYYVLTSRRGENHPDRWSWEIRRKSKFRNVLPSTQRGTRAGRYGGVVILVVAATPEELRGAGRAAALSCGVGPVEAAARTAAALTVQLPAAVLHVGIAGGRSFEGPVFVIGSPEARTPE